MAISIEVEPALQIQAEETFAKVGLPLSEAVNLFLKAAVRYGGLPFEDKAECYNEETRQAIEEVERGEGLSRTFATIDELMEDLMSDA